MTNKKPSDILEQQIIDKENAIEKREEEIIGLEQELLKKVEKLDRVEKTISRIEHYRRRTVKKLAKHRFIFSILVSLSFVLVWRGLWDVTASLPILKEAGIALIIGFFMMWLLERYTDE